jgi:signal transduction histidine kinase
MVQQHVDLERLAAEQAALRRIATFVAGGAAEGELAAAVTSEIGRLLGAQRANMMRLEGEALRVIGDWSAVGGPPPAVGSVFSFGGDTISARVVQTASSARVDSAADLRTEFAQRRWAELGLEASIGAPVLVAGEIWGVVTASRTSPNDPFPPGAEHHLRDFATLVAQAIVNAEARRETADVVAEQSALRQIATDVAAGRPVSRVLEAVTAEAGRLLEATSVTLVRWEGVLDEVAVVAAWSHPEAAPVEAGSLYHPDPAAATIAVLETGKSSRAQEASPERGVCSVIGAPVIGNAVLLGALTASRPVSTPFPPGAEMRLWRFADLAAQAIANERAQSELRASRARLVRAADETRQRLERNLHDGAQQRLVSLSLALRLLESQLERDPARARELLADAHAELSVALEELRELARGLHPAILSNRGLAPAVEALAERSTVPVEVELALEAPLPEAVEVAFYYVVSEALANAAKHADASKVVVSARCVEDSAELDVLDDGIGGADLAGGTGIRGLGDRVEALGGRFRVLSPPGRGTRIRVVIPLAADLAPAPIKAG